jgi:hypothetical protein
MLHKMAHHPLYIIVFLCFISLSLNGQSRGGEAINLEIESGDGSILLNNGEELKGHIKLNDREGVVTIVNDDLSKAYVARNVMGFEFYDIIQKRQRVFYSLKFKEEKDTVRKTFFFEVLRDFTDFAVISKVDPMDVKIKSGDSGPTYIPNGFSMPSGDIGVSTIIKQTETVYFLGKNGLIEPYFKVTRKVVEGRLMDRDRSKRKMLDETLIRKYFSEEEIAGMQKFSEKNHLIFEAKEDLIKILASVTINR